MSRQNHKIIDNNHISISFDQLIDMIKKGHHHIRLQKNSYSKNFSKTSKVFHNHPVFVDSKHPIVIKSPKRIIDDYIIYIDKDFFKKHKQEIQDAAFYSFTQMTKNTYIIYNNIYTPKLLEYCLNHEGATIFLVGVSLTNLELEEIKKHHANVYLDGKQIQNSYVIGLIKYNDTLKKGPFKISIDELENCNLDNFKFFKDNAILEIRENKLFKERHNKSNEIINEDEYYDRIFKVLSKIDKQEKKLYFKIYVTKRSIFDKYLQKYHFNNIYLRIINDNYEYSFKEYTNEESILESLVYRIKKANLSPLEKFLAVYNIVKNFKPYKENKENYEQSRRISSILYNDYIVCAGYANLLVCLLDMVGIEANALPMRVDISYDKDLDENDSEEIPTQMEDHLRVVVDINDSKYNIHGLYMSDPTWDNNLNEDYINHALMTFNSTITHQRMVSFSINEPILGFNTFNEYTKQIDYLINVEIDKYNKKYPMDKDHVDIVLLIAFKNVATAILKTIKCDPEITTFIQLLSKCQKKEDYELFFTELGNYLLLRINNPVDTLKLLEANRIANDVIHKRNRRRALAIFNNEDRRISPYEMPEDINNHNLKAK